MVQVSTMSSLLHYKDLQILIERKPFFKLAKINFEWVNDVPDLERVYELTKGKADVLMFWERLPRKPNLKIKNRDNVSIAAIPLVNYKYWWNSQIDKKTRNMVRKALKKGVEVKVEGLTDELIHGMEKIYKEAQMRQNKAFAYYGETFEQLKKDFSIWNSHRYSHDFLVAYSGEEVIGFQHLIYTKDSALISAFLSMKRHSNKGPNNLLISKSVEICCRKNLKYLIFERMTGGSLGKFKQKNGFMKMDVPRYYIPLSRLGKIICFFKMYRDLIYYYSILPRWIQHVILKLRARAHSSLYWKLRKRT